MPKESIVAREIKQKKPFTSLEEEAYVALLRTTDALGFGAIELFKDYGISPTQYNVLRILRGSEPCGRRCGEIAERMVTRDPDITRLLDRMEKSGWITRKRDQGDRRVVVTKITSKGLDLLKQMDRPLAEFHKRQLGHVGEQKLRKLLELLNVARSGCQE